MSSSSIGILTIGFTKKAAAGSKEFFTPEQGNVKISCTDDKGRNSDAYVTVNYVDY
jgi:penicillin-binding protein 1C